MSMDKDRTNAEKRGTDDKEPLYVCRINILRADSVPVADLHNLSCDPYIQATLSVGHDSLSSDDIQFLTYRTHTVRRTLNPVFNTPWIVSGVPASGFLLSLRLRDEDPGNYDDDLGKAVIRIPWPNEEPNRLRKGWESGEREYKVKKRRGSILSHLFTYVANVVTGGDVGHRVRVWISIEVLDEVHDQKDTRLCTVGPRRYIRHFSPFLGRVLGSSNSPDDPENSQGNESTPSKVKPTAFVANRLQLAGPIPEPLRHRYVGFAPFVKAMFRRRGIRGLLLHHALHKQHMAIYRWDAHTVWGCIGDIEAEGGGYAASSYHGEPKEGGQGEACKDADAVAFARQFLRMTSHGTNGRVFTYVIMLDGEWRFTETGEHFTIQFLSKHTMHSDIAVEVAYSGEFFIRPLRRSGTSRTHSHASSGNEEKPSKQERQEHGQDHLSDEALQPSDPAQYELIIDNDSGTYRPRADLLPVLHSYLARPDNLGALGRITCLNAFDDKLKKWKEERKCEKEKKEGHTRIERQLSVSSVSSSGSSASSASGISGDKERGHGGERVTKEDVEKALEEDAKRARDNDDQDADAKKEEREEGEGSR